LKLIAFSLNPESRIAGLASSSPVDDSNAQRLTLATSKDRADLDATWMLTSFLTSVADLIAEHGWATAMSRFVPEDWSSPTSRLVLIEDPRNVLAPGHEGERAGQN
jgi:hypothetical protein